MNSDLKTRDKIDIGIISDTHGSLGPKALSALSRADVIVHAGDFDTPEVLHALNILCPVIAVRGNMDYGHWAADLPAADMVELGGIHLYLLHNLNTLDLDPIAAEVKVVVSGHTHQAAAVQSNEALSASIRFLDFADETAFVNSASQLIASLTAAYPYTAVLVDAETAREHLSQSLKRLTP